MTLIYCGVGEVNVIVGDESVALKADEAARLDGYAGEVKLCSKSGRKADARQGEGNLIEVDVKNHIRCSMKELRMWFSFLEWLWCT